MGNPWVRVKRNIIRILKDVGIALSLLWAGYNAWTKDALYKKAELEKDELRQTMAEVVVKIANDKYEINDIPFPMWQKLYVPMDDTFRMVKINQAYRDKYGVSNIFYFGKQDKNVSVKGEIYEANDRKVMEMGPGEVLYVYEPYVTDGVEKVGKYAKWKVQKGDLVYVYGMEVE